jgi:mono/diheme cytochrome c family protein
MASTRRSGLFTAGIVLVALGVVALVVLLALALPSGGPLHRYAPGYSPTQGSSGSPGTTPGSSSSLGQRIYLTGTDANGNTIPRTRVGGMMASGLACADCHGSDAKGRSIRVMMGQYDTPDIRWSTLSSAVDPEGQPQTPFDEAGFARAVRDGVDPEGQTLKFPMPHWQLTDAQVQALIQYLQTL